MPLTPEKSAERAELARLLTPLFTSITKIENEIYGPWLNGINSTRGPGLDADLRNTAGAEERAAIIGILKQRKVRLETVLTKEEDLTK